MNRESLAQALCEAGIESAIVSEADLSGGCIHRVRRVTLDNGSSYIVKSNQASQRCLFDEEAAGLHALAKTNAILVPVPLRVGVQGTDSVLIMTEISSNPANEDAWRSLGSDLASMHQYDAGTRYGFAHDNHIGATVQRNDWCDDWIEFMAVHRLGIQIDLAERSGLLHDDESRRLKHVVDRLDEFLIPCPRPSLLHGDLWSGNAIPTIDDTGAARVAIIDPAVSIGDGWADIAMMKLFGGFSPICFDHYASLNDDHELLESRLQVYQLYHVLNHLNLFGRGYIGQAMDLVVRLLG